MSDPRRLALVLVFLLLSLVKVARHEIWADEAEYWDAARSSHSLSELRENTRYMGQPPLNHLVFYALSRFTRDPRAMQVLNVVETTGAVAIVAFCAPWPFAVRALFAFGYFPFFEYGTISRHYALMLLLALALAAAWTRDVRKSPRVAGLGALLALSNFHGTLLALAFLLAHVATAPGRGAKTPRERAGLAALLAGIVASSLLARPPDDAAFLSPWAPSWNPPRLVMTASQLWHAYAPLPPLAPPWWNRFLLQPWPALEIALGLGVFAWLLWTVRRAPLAVAFLAIASLGLSAFTYLQAGGAARHAGALFVAAVVAGWLAGAQARIGLLLALQLPGALVLGYQDLVGPFSASVATADYIKTHGLAELPMVGHNEVVVAPVFALLDRPFYSPDSGDWRTRPVFGPQLHPAPLSEVSAAARRLQKERGSDVVLVLGHAAPPASRSMLLARFRDDFLGREFWVYRLEAAAP